MRWSCSKRLAYMVATIAKESEKRGQSTVDKSMIKKWSYNNLRQAYLQQPCSLPGLRRKETITVTHAVDVF